MTPSETRLLMLIDDEPAQTRLVSALAAREGWRVLSVATPAEASAALAGEGRRDVAALLFDQRLLGAGACDFVRDIRAAHPDLPVIVMTASTSPLLAVEAIRAGATDYLIKPVSPERLVHALRCAVQTGAPSAELQPLTEKQAPVLEFDSIVGAAGNFRTALARAATAARGHGHVLVEGERGTGKEMLMRAMHHASARSKLPVRLVNCADMLPNSLASLLFGHEKGAFPGAFNAQTGILQDCDGGTVLIDEIDRMDRGVQEKLASVLETGIVRPTGAAHGYKIDVRIFASSDVNLTELADKGEFDANLLARLSATRLTLPPLRERAGDIPALTRHFLAKIAQQPGMAHHSIADSGLSLLEAYNWPGNVRQLQATLWRAAVFCDGEALTADSFPQLAQMLGNADRGESRARGLGVLLYTDDGNLRPLEEIEADIIRLAIGHYRGRMTEVARRLGIGRSTLYRKLSELGIDDAA